MNRPTAQATSQSSSSALPPPPPGPAPDRPWRPGAAVRDLRGEDGPHELCFGPYDLVVVTGLPGGGKSTLMRRAVRGGLRVDSQDTRDRWDARLAPYFPYVLYRPLVRLAHYAGLRGALRSGGPVVVHDCGTQPWVRAWLARTARRRGAALHLLLLDVAPGTALAGQRERGRGVSPYAFRRHCRAVTRLLRALRRGELPQGCDSAVLLDREAAAALHRIEFAPVPDNLPVTEVVPSRR